MTRTCWLCNAPLITMNERTACGACGLYHVHIPAGIFSRPAGHLTSGATYSRSAGPSYSKGNTQ